MKATGNRSNVVLGKRILRFKERIRELTCRTRGISMEQRGKELAAYLRGWRGYFGFCQTRLPPYCTALISGYGADYGRCCGNSGNEDPGGLPKSANEASDLTLRLKPPAVPMAHGGSQAALPSASLCQMPTSTHSASPL